jgi:hypothetical protein
MDLRPFTRKAWINLAALGLSAAYGIIMRLAFSSPPGSHPLATQASAIMSVAFLFGVPFVMGFLAVTMRFQLQRESGGDQPTIVYWVFFPWLPAIVALLIAALFAWEGYICLLFATPIMLPMASIGGIAAGATQWWRFRAAQLSVVALFPLVLVIFETRMPDPASSRIVETTIRIHAPAPIVWQNIIRVPAIRSAELPHSWVQTVGFPKPVEATLSHEGIGGVRHASFTGGLVFTETIDRWDTLRDLSFSIHANTDEIPPTTLDEHVKVGGRYFEVLEGEYSLEALPDGNTLLHLVSRERVSTHFNPYAGLWTDAVMRSIQDSILKVIKHRAEAQGVDTASNRE